MCTSGTHQESVLILRLWDRQVARNSFLATFSEGCSRIFHSVACATFALSSSGFHRSLLQRLNFLQAFAVLKHTVRCGSLSRLHFPLTTVQKYPKMAQECTPDVTSGSLNTNLVC